MGKPKPHRDDDLRSRILKLEAELAAINAAKLCDEEVARMLAALPNKQTAGPFNRLAHTLVGKLAAMTAERDDDARRYLRRGNHFAEAAKRYREMFRTAQAQLTASEVARGIGAEIMEIMATYREQEASSYGVDTPGGLEHMGDVWALLTRWDDRLRAAKPKEKP